MSQDDTYSVFTGWLSRAAGYLADGEVTLPNGKLIQYAGDPYGKRLLVMVERILALHSSRPGDEYAELRCNACVAGYDPRTGDLVNAAWPCGTVETVLGVQLLDEDAA